MLPEPDPLVARKNCAKRGCLIFNNAGDVVWALVNLKNM